MKQEDVEKMRDALEELPPAKELPPAFRGHVRSAERRVKQERESEKHQKELEEQWKKKEEQLKEWEKREEPSLIASSPEELYSDSLMRYKQAIALAKEPYRRRGY